MRTLDINTALVDGYLKLLDNLSTASKLDLILKLTQSVKTDLGEKTTRFYAAFGAWESSESADEIIEDIRKDRNFHRQIESF